MNRFDFINKIPEWILIPAFFISLLTAITISVFTVYHINESEIHTIQSEIQIVDKWHEESCDPIYVNNGYAGEACSDVWTVAYVTPNGNRFTEKMRNSKFKEIKIDDKYLLTIERGKLNILVSETWKKIS